MIHTYTQDDLADHCRILAKQDQRLRSILDRHGPPPFWHREPGFACLIRIILEQQVSLASAYAVYSKLESRLGVITADAMLAASDEALKQCGFSRQKMAYARILAKAIVSGELDVDGLARLPDQDVRRELIRIKGIGEWTVNVYLLLSLHRLDVFPSGDLALVKAMHRYGYLGPGDKREAVLAQAEAFVPRRSILAILLWHGYITENNVLMPE